MNEISMREEIADYLMNCWEYALSDDEIEKTVNEIVYKVLDDNELNNILNETIYFYASKFVEKNFGKNKEVE